MRSPSYLYLCSGAIGEALVGIHIARTLDANVPGSVVRIMLPRPNPFVQELVRELPFVEYQELSKSKLSGWLGLLPLIGRTYRSVVLETVTVGIPLWWRIILWCARTGPGSVQVRYQMRGRERAIPRGTVRLSYDCQTENYFDTPPRVLAAWGVPAPVVPSPVLPVPAAEPRPPYILFHFFAGNYKRSIPLEHARSILAAAREAYPDHAFVMTCMASERERAERMREGMENVHLDSNLEARAVLALLAGADLVVGTASGILLAAAHVGAKIVAMSCLSDPCWLPTFSPSATIVAAREECRCNADKTSDCSVSTPEGDMFRCLYYIKTETVIAEMQRKLPGA